MLSLRNRKLSRESPAFSFPSSVFVIPLRRIEGRTRAGVGDRTSLISTGGKIFHSLSDSLRYASHSRSKHPNTHIHTPRSNHTPNRLPGLALPLPPCPIHHPRHSSPRHSRRPPQTAHKMPMRIINTLNALALLAQVPAPDRLIVTYTQQIFPAGVEDQSPDPVIVAEECFDEGAPVVPDLDALVSAPCGEELA